MSEPKVIRQSILFKHEQCRTCYASNILTVGFHPTDSTSAARVCVDCLELAIRVAKMLKKLGVK